MRRRGAYDERIACCDSERTDILELGAVLRRRAIACRSGSSAPDGTVPAAMGGGERRLGGFEVGLCGPEAERLVEKLGLTRISDREILAGFLAVAALAGCGGFGDGKRRGAGGGRDGGNVGCSSWRVFLESSRWLKTRRISMWVRA